MKEQNFITNPSKKVLITFTILYALSIGLLIFSLYNEGVTFYRPNLMLQLLIGMAIWSLVKLYLNYFKNKRTKNEQQNF